MPEAENHHHPPMAIARHADMKTTNVYIRKVGIEFKDGTEKLGYKVPTNNDAKVFKFVTGDF